MSAADPAAAELSQQLSDRMLSFQHDPLGYVVYNYGWGEDELVGCEGPRKWQHEVLEFIGRWFSNSLEGEDLERFGSETRDKVCRVAISSGHGPGKTTLGAWVASWAKDTLLDAMVRVTANTDRQLTTVMQPEFSRWHRRSLNADDWDVHTQAIKARDPKHDDTWRLDFMPWSHDNPQAFAGKHNAGRRMMLLIEEASEVSDEIFRVANGALIDSNTEKIFLIISNPTRNTGYFYEAVFGSQRSRWKNWIIDSRDVEGCNRDEINSWLTECEGNDDADYFRVRARGLYPKGAAGQYIDLERIHQAQERHVWEFSDEPLIAGCDFAWGGAADNVIRFRRGSDARSIPPIKVKGEFTRDPAVMRNKIVEVLSSTYDGRKVEHMFCDSAGIAGRVVAGVRELGYDNITEVNFGADSPDPKAVLWRDCMWMRMYEWLAYGAIDADPGLAADLGKPQCVFDKLQRIKLESKEIMMKRLARMGLEAASPDDADALGLTFAIPVVKMQKPAAAESSHVPTTERLGDGGWMR